MAIIYGGPDKRKVMALLYSGKVKEVWSTDDPNIIEFRYTKDYSVERLLRDAKLYEIGAGTSEIRRMLIGRELFLETK